MHGSQTVRGRRDSLRVKWLSLPEAHGAAREGNAMAMERYSRPELDVLRCFAFLMVFASHTVPGSTAVGGAFGVDLFFTLSSFLITTLLLRESSVCGALDVTAFYLRRVLRILPLYFGFLLAATTLARSLVPDENLPLKYVVAFALLCGNWACVLWGYPHSVATPLWSVSIEEQFYLCWPLIMRRWVHRLTMVAVGLVVVSFRSEEHTSELQSLRHLVCRLLLEKKNKTY